MQKKKYAHRVRNYKPVVWKSYSSFEEEVITEYIREHPEEVFPELQAQYNLYSGQILKDRYIMDNVLSGLDYTTENLKSFYEDHQHRYILTNNQEKAQSFDQAFPLVLKDYQQEAVNDWQKQLFDEQNVKIRKSAINRLLKNLNHENH